MKKKLLQFTGTMLLFFLVTMPFRQFFAVNAVTEVRPASAFPPVFGLLFGVPGVLGCAVGNLFADIASGYSPLLCILGFIAQFLYGYVPYKLWYLHQDADGGAPATPRLNTTKRVLKYIAVMLTDAVMMAVLLGGIMQALGIGTLFSTATLMLLLNNFVFCMVLGIPILILFSIGSREKKSIVVSLNEKFILIFLLLGVISACLIGGITYFELSKQNTAPLELWNRIYFYIGLDLLVFYIITVLFLWYAERSITIPVESLAKIAKGYVAKDNLDSSNIVAECEALCHNRSETGYLAFTFKRMVQDLDEYIENLSCVTADKERIATELHVATQIQTSMLPCIFPAFPDRPEFDIYATMNAAKEVGGDFYDFFLIDKTHLAVVIADVSGKGVPAALFMVIAKTLIKNYAQLGAPPSEVFELVNNQLCETNDAGMFVTAFMGVWELETGKFTYVNAGHNPPLLSRADKKYDWLEMSPGFVLAGMEETIYTQQETTLCPGDRLFLYTDGVTEAQNLAEELYSDQRLLGLFNSGALLGKSPGEMLTLVRADIADFADGAEQADDITMLMLKINERGTNNG